MDSHPKKKKKPVQSKSEINPRSRHWQRKPNTIYTKQKQTKPHYPILQYRLVYQKKKNPIQRKPNPRPRANQTHSETVTLLVGAARSVARRPCLVIVARPPRLVVVARPPLVIARREGLVANRRRSQIADRCSAASVLSLKVFLSLFLSDSHSLYLKSEMNESISVSVSLYSLRVTLSL